MPRTSWICAMLCGCLPWHSLAAGWDTNAWPAVEHPRSGAVHAEQCRAAVAERAAAANLAVPAEATFYRSQRVILESCKAAIATAIPQYMAAAGDVDILAYLEAHDTLPAAWTVTGMCAAASLPTNYFTYTPWRALCGLGPFTNDVSVGNPHGWTNAYTAAGGAATLPAGRSTWYTTDYGWQGLREVCDRLAVYAGPAPIMTNSIWVTWYSSPTGTVSYGVYDGILPVCQMAISHSDFSRSHITGTAMASSTSVVSKSYSVYAYSTNIYANNTYYDFGSGYVEGWQWVGASAASTSALHLVDLFYYGNVLDSSDIPTEEEFVYWFNLGSYKAPGVPWIFGVWDIDFEYGSEE